MAKSIVNVKLKKPTTKVPNWTKEAKLWGELRKAAGGSARHFPLTIKAGYVIGAMYDIFQSVSHLLRHPKARELTYVPAYQCFCSGVELLGRCIRGNTDLWGNVADLQAGFKWLAGYEQVGLHDDTVVIKTKRQKYTVDMLTALGHYAGLGGATARRSHRGMRHAGRIDPEILEKMLPLLVEGLGRYWKKLQNSGRMCKHLARARVIGLKDWPVLSTWLLHDGHDGASVPSLADTFGQLDWSL
jgi:hypothetical protein